MAGAVLAWWLNPYFFKTTEFFVIAAIAAALVVGFMAMPRRRGAARQFFVRADVIDSDLTPPSGDDPWIEVTCRDDGSVVIYRRGLTDLYSSGEVNLAVTIIGNDVTIQERVVDGSAWSSRAYEALAVLDMLGRDRYHIQYISEATGRLAAFTLNNRPGFHTLRPLNQ